MDDLKQQAQRLKVLWKSGRDKYTSFFTVLREVKVVVGDERLADWCFDELRIGLPVIMRYRDLLSASDDEYVKTDMAVALEAEKKAREEKKFQESLEKARRAKELAEVRAEAARIQAESKVEVARINATRKKTQAAENRRQKKQTDVNERGPLASAKRRKREFVANISDADLAEMVKRFEAAEKLCVAGIEQWIEGSIAKALILAAARDKFTANDEFGAWVDRLDSAVKTIGEQDRAALVGLGRLGEPRLREILTSTESRSYRMIWRENKPKLSLVEDVSA